MAGLKKLLGVFALLTGIAGSGGASATMPVPPLQSNSPSMAESVRIICGPRGCYETRDRRYYRDRYYRGPMPLDPGWFFGGPPVFVVPPVRRHYSSNAHVRWCYNRYRSYNARTDTFLGYDGRFHRCNSPYR